MNEQAGNPIDDEMLGQWRARCPELAEASLKAHLSRLPRAYANRFSENELAEHAQVLNELNDQNVAHVTFETDKADRLVVTVFAFDHPFEFSLITGLLAGSSFRIERGDVYTLPKAAMPAPASGHRRRPGGGPGRSRRASMLKAKMDGLKHSVIIDRFVGHLPEGTDATVWQQQFSDAIVDVLTLQHKADEDSIALAKKRVNAKVTDRLTDISRVEDTAMSPINLEIEQLDDQATRLHIQGQDTPAFLYSLSTALSLHRLSIRHVQIESEGAYVSDIIDVSDLHGNAITDEKTIRRVKLSVLLTKQFTYFVTFSPDPFTALSRFERLCEDIMEGEHADRWLGILSDPRNLQDLARILGASDYLWEDFIRAQYNALLPIFSPQAEGGHFRHDPATLPMRLEQTLDEQPTFKEKAAALNRFKDNEIFLIDLDHILNPSVDFRELATRLTLLAELLIAAASNLVYENLVEQHGEPKDDAGKPIPYAVFGLGKLGGIALGYASDIELLFIYGSDGKTSGDRPITSSQFYEKLVTEIRTLIKTKREGIFEIDLRLRPYGKEGALASSLNHFQSYYTLDNAHPFERIALVRLRWIAGDPELGSAVEKARDAFVYAPDEPDLEELWDIWSRQKDQKLASGGINTKYSPGALVDLEGALQLLQVQHAKRVPQLRSPRISEVLGSLRRGGVISSSQYARLAGAYHFLRRLINSQRMLRGNAQDLFLPDEGSPEYQHLARRMGYRKAGGKTEVQQLQTEFAERTKAIQAFVKEMFNRPCPGCA